MATADNESAVCEAVLRFLSQGAHVAVEHRPDQTDRRATAVELVAAVGDRRLAIEHTRIESFGRQIADGEQFAALFGPLEHELTALLPPDRYGITVDVHVVRRVRRADVAAVQHSLREWVTRTAPALARGRRDPGAPPNTPWSITAQPAGVPFAVTLTRTRSEGDRARVVVSRFAPPDVEGLRRQRIAVALDRKCPKLQRAKLSFGAESVLVLESDDLALANEGVIGDAVRAELSARSSDVPDTVVLVETHRGLTWQLWIFRERGRTLSEGEERGPYDLADPGLQ